MLFCYFGVLEVYIILYLEKIDISQFFLNRYKYTIFCIYLYVYTTWIKLVARLAEFFRCRS